MTFARGLVTQSEVVHALILRETRTRFGAHQLGYLWALLEPTFLILTFFVLFQLGKRTAPFQMDLFGFLTTGLIPYQLFSSTTSRVAESINGNKALLFYPQVYPLDLAIARTVLEIITYTWIFIALMAVSALSTQTLQIDDLLQVVSGFALASLLGATLGLVLCALGQYSNAIDRARGPLLRPMFWISGIFFAANSLPTNLREYALFNPVLHCVELVRGGWFSSYDATHAQPGYVLAWILVFALMGVTLERVVRRRIQVS